MTRVRYRALTILCHSTVLRRLVVLAHPSQAASPQMAALDAVFTSHAVLTLAHILPAMAFVLLTPFVFSRSVDAMWPERFGIAFWIGFSLNLIAVDLWLYSRKPRSQATR